MYAPRLWHENQLLFLCDQQAPHSSTSSMHEEVETTAIPAQHNSSLKFDIMEMICTHLNYKLNWSIFFRFNCACVVKPLAGQTEQTWHSLSFIVKTEGKTVRVWGPKKSYLFSELIPEPAVHVELRGESHDKCQSLQRFHGVAPALSTEPSAL